MKMFDLEKKYPEKCSICLLFIYVTILNGII